MRNFFVLTAGILLIFTSCTTKKQEKTFELTNKAGQAVYIDKPFIQEFSVKYYLPDDKKSSIVSVATDRNGLIKVLSSAGKLLVPDNGSLFYSGKLIEDITYEPMQKKNLLAMTSVGNQFVYLDNRQIFSNAWAGKLQIDHNLPEAKMFGAVKDFQFLVSDGKKSVLLTESGETKWTLETPGLKQIKFDAQNNHFILVYPEKVAAADLSGQVKTLFEGAGITCAQPVSGDTVVIGTTQGYLFTPGNKLISKVPCSEITCVSKIENEIWFGSTNGAFRLNSDKTYSYFAGERWLPGNMVFDIQPGPENSVLILTDKGIGQLHFQKMTLEEKAHFYEKQVRKKNIRYGFNCSSVQMPNGYSTAQTGPQPSDNLWTGMYLVSQLYRYKVTGSAEAKQNAMEAFEAMERLHTVTGIPGLFGRSFERDYKTENTKTEGWELKELKSGSPAMIWLPCKDHPNWTWRSTASSDQTVGQIFALTAILELADDTLWKQRALTMLDNLMNYIVDNNLYIIDVDGEPTLWGKWNPDYVNSFPTNVGDRKINSSNIIAFLQTAYKFTGKEKYREKAFEMMDKFGYLENLMRPMSEIGKSDSTASEWAKTLSHEWNHSDDEMYFLAYWGLYPYAFSPELKEKFREAIRDHWEAERPEKNALWNFTYAMTGAKDFDLKESVDFLQQYPIDMRNWAVQNSHRKDIELLPANFRNQTTKTLLPLGEIPLYRHNGEIFRLDSQGNGTSLISAGDVWLLPYWMGRYLGVISAPDKE